MFLEGDRTKIRVGKNSHPKKKESEERSLLHVTPKEDKDPYRWVVILLFLLVLFVTYVFWVQGI